MRPLEAGDPATVGPYTVLGRLGEGGMGVVYLARTASGRAVAVKTIRPELGAQPEFRERFRAETEAARRVGGFHTAPVVDADPDGSPPWMATAFVPGPSLRDTVESAGPLDEGALRTLGAGLAEALDAIHSAGVVHRDLKPSNILLTADGPRVIDFGIARAMEGTALTATGSVLGSPGYLSPEQALGDRVGPASDVFALGAVLAFAAGAPGFGSGTAPVLLFRVVHETPDLTGVPESLLPVIRACLAKQPEQRPTPAEVLGALAPAATGPGEGPQPPEGTGPSLDQRPTVTTTLADQAAPTPSREPTPPTGAPTPEPLDEQTSAQGPASAGRLTIRRFPRRSRLRTAAALVITLTAVALVVARLIPPGHPTHHALAAPSTSASPTPTGGPGAQDTSSPSAGPGTSPSPTPLSTTVEQKDSMTTLAFSPDGATLATGNMNVGVRLLNLATRQSVVVDAHTILIYDIAFSPDGRTVATSANREPIRLWDTRTGAGIRSMADSDSVQRLAFSPDGRTLAAAAGSTVHLWDVGTGDSTAALTSDTRGNVYALAFSPDGRTLATADRNVHLWDVSTATLRTTLAGTANIGVSALAFSSDGQTLTGAGLYDNDGTVFRWTLTGATTVSSFQTPGAEPLALSADGRTFITKNVTQTVGVWDVQTGQRVSVLGDFPQGVLAAVSPDGSTLVTVNGVYGPSQLWPLTPHPAGPPT